jgi:hypothetical protein
MARVAEHREQIGLSEYVADALAREQRILARIGAVLAIVAPLVLAASFIPHGDLPTDDSTLVGEAEALRFIAQHPSWLVIHLGTIVAGLLWVGAFIAFAGTLAPGAAGAVGRLLVPSAIIGGTFLVFDYGVYGYAFWALATEWAAASGSEKAQLLMMADTALVMLNGTFRGEIVILYGLTVLLAGLAVALDGRYAVWFGTIGAIAGAAVLANGLLSYAGISLTREDMLIFVVVLPLESLWLLALGVLMWRRTDRPNLWTERTRRGA